MWKCCIEPTSVSFTATLTEPSIRQPQTASWALTCQLLSWWERRAFGCVSSLRCLSPWPLCTSGDPSISLHHLSPTWLVNNKPTNMWRWWTSDGGSGLHNNNTLMGSAGPGKLSAAGLYWTYFLVRCLTAVGMSYHHHQCHAGDCC